MRKAHLLIKKLSIKLYNICKGHWSYDKFDCVVEELFQPRCNYFSVNIPLEIKLLATGFERYRTAKNLIKYGSIFKIGYLTSLKIIEKFENDVKKRLDPYLCDDLIYIIVGFLTK